MELKCANCGHPLSSEDAKYCNNCGTLTPSHPFSPHARAKAQAASHEEKSSPTSEDEKKHSIDSHPKSSRPSSAARKDDWKLDQGGSGAKSPRVEASSVSLASSGESKSRQGEVSNARTRQSGDISWPEPVTHMVTKEASPSLDGEQAASTQISFDDFAAVPIPAKVGEFRVKVWDQDENVHDQHPLADDEVELQPTRPLQMTEPEKEQKQKNTHDAEDIEHLPTQSLQVEDIRKESQLHEDQERQRREGFEMQETTPLVAQPAPQNKGPKTPLPLADDFAKPTWNGEDAFPVVERGNSPRQHPESPSLPGFDDKTVLETPHPFQNQDRPTQLDPTATPFLGLDQHGFPTENAPETPQPAAEWQGYNAFASNEVAPATPSPVQPTPPKSADQKSSAGRGKLIAGVLVTILVLGGLGFWLIVGHPFNQGEPAWQTYSNGTAKISMELPPDWTTLAGSSSQSIALGDSTKTGLIDIAISNDAPSDLTKYLTQQATKLSMDNITPSGSVAFGGAQWTQLHGSIDVQSASYTAVLLATNHNGHLYMISFKAPQNSYTNFDKATFSHVRTTFKFL
ncbi:zinc ribbon domain-containing protein [Ktedonospora formicarum]|uniref:Zinc-ribbon domain-containing protein n=1 Tax=Ktedonospora formicarum TaxID=2778364 RepID=A0A8J3IDR6_9CHLR|nr:zinc ribbon domain-containing protein [Ktedonospora formicarum]GHO50149.1 hypothetical protein KSX_83120 [Ktedonospora formicarum]